MTVTTLTTTHLGKEVVVSLNTPSEVQDPGRVRMGAGLHVHWLSLEIMNYLLKIMHG